MEKVEIDLIERFGLMTEDDGLPKIAGRVFGLLMLSEEPLTLDEIAEHLQVSKASVSTNTRLLDQLGIVERVSKPGDRRAFYEVAPDAIVGNFDRIRQRITGVVEILDDTLPKLSDEKQVARQRLTLMHRWHIFLLDELDELIQRWQAREEE